MRFLSGWMFLWFSFLVSTLPAQTAGVLGTIPKGFVNREGSSSHYAGWRYAPARTLAVIYPTLVPSTLKTARGLRIRPNFDMHRAKSLTIEVALADRGVQTNSSWASPLWSYYLKWSNRTVVMKRRTIQFPAVPAVATPPVPWKYAVTLPFDKPWTRTGTASDPLAIDCKFFSKTQNSIYWYADAEYLPSKGTGVPYGRGCPTGNEVSFMRSDKVYPVSNVYSYGYTRGRGDLATACVGIKKAAIPIPGAQGCYLFTRPVYWHSQVVRTTTNDGYTGLFAWGPVPVNRLFYTEIVSQIVALSPQGRIKALRATSFRLGAFGWDMVMLFDYAVGSHTFDPDRSPMASYYTDVIPIYGFY